MANIKSYIFGKQIVGRDLLPFLSPFSKAFNSAFRTPPLLRRKADSSSVRATCCSFPHFSGRRRLRSWNARLYIAKQCKFVLISQKRSLLYPKPSPAGDGGFRMRSLRKTDEVSFTLFPFVMTNRERHKNKAPKFGALSIFWY